LIPSWVGSGQRLNS